MKGAGIVVTSIPTMKAKVVAAIVLTVKVEVVAPVVKAKEVAIATPTIKVEVVEKKRRVKLPKLKMSVDHHGLPSGDLQKPFDARVRLLCRVYLDDCHVKWSVQKKSKATTTIIKKLLHDFEGNWNVDAVL
jgi:nitrous oxide reductase